MSVGLFRGMVLASWLLAVTGAAVDLVWPELLPEELAFAVENLPPLAGLESDSFTFELVLSGGALLLLAALIVASVGVCWFKPRARPVLLWSTVLMLPVTLWTGPAAYSGLAQVLLDASWMLWGAVLAAAYWSPLAARFKRP